MTGESVEEVIADDPSKEDETEEEEAEEAEEDRNDMTSTPPVAVEDWGC